METFQAAEHISEWANASWSKMCGRKNQYRFHERELNAYSQLWVTGGDLAPISVTDPNVSGSKMTKINCPLELEGS